MSNSPATKLHVFENSNRRLHPPEAWEEPSRPDPLLTAEDVASRLNVTKDWVWDHSSRKHPFLPVIRMSDGTLRYRASKIEDFIDERERLTRMRRSRARMKRPNCSPAEIEE